MSDIDEFIKNLVSSMARKENVTEELMKEVGYTDESKFIQDVCDRTLEILYYARNGSSVELVRGLSDILDDKITTVALAKLLMHLIKNNPGEATRVMFTMMAGCSDPHTWLDKFLE